ncbi:putative cysteine protease domain-containing protein [Eutypa lata UCREL1]|uniref:Putative cysteine protease domain-containing protein n=1 Tax=Eutypa lata (strain UCR-EL1) TaxID=1287681 RepID=M7SBT6_EUTLA|nr:putative cysteine protease domain-containing protein [Eutypa lata UCREL1]
MISKQWQLVHGYSIIVSRDVHLIQRKLEIIPNFDVAEKLLEDLFRHRQNCARYEKQLHDTMEEFKQSLGREDLPVIYDLEAIREGFHQLSRATERNINLLTDLTAIKEAQQGLDENHGITKLTHIATIYLPFSTVAAVLAMPDSFAPGANRFWVYWVASMILAAFVIMAVLLYKPAQSFLKRSQGREDDQAEIEIGVSEKSGGLVSRLIPQRRVSGEKRKEELPRFK